MDSMSAPFSGGGGSIVDAATSFSEPASASQVMFPNASSNTGVFPDPQQQGGFDISKILPAAIGGIGNIIGLARGQGSATDKALKAQGKATQGIAAAGNQALQGYTSGQTTPSQQAALDQWEQQQLAKWRQYLASAGIPEGSAMADITAKVAQDKLVKAQQFMQQDFENAYKAAGLNTTNLSNLAQKQAIQDAEQRKAWADFMQQLAKIGGDIGPIMVGGNNPLC